MQPPPEITAPSLHEHAPAFAFLGPHHLVPAAVIILLSAAVPLAARRSPEAPWVRRFMLGLGWILLINQLAWHGRAIAAREWSAGKYLPLHLCDAATIVTILVLFRPRPRLFELCWFWGLAGGWNAIITPDILRGFPDLFWWQFFITHGGIVVTPLLLAFGLGMRLERGAVWRALLWTNAVALAAGVANALTGANYMFLREPPPTGSLLDELGPWPWYILVCEGLAVLLFGLLALPFARSREAARGGNGVDRQAPA